MSRQRHDQKTVCNPCQTCFLEYGNCIRSSRFKKEYYKIEQMQRRATKLIPELREKSYQDRLKELRLPSLYHTQKSGDMIQTFKIIEYSIEFQQILQDKMFRFSYSVMRGHNFKLQKQLPGLFKYECKQLHNFLHIYATNIFYTFLERTICRL